MTHEKLNAYHLFDEWSVVFVVCEGCTKRFGMMCRPGYYYRPLCGPCAKELGEQVETPKNKEPSNA